MFMGIMGGGELGRVDLTLQDKVSHSSVIRRRELRIEGFVK